MTNKTVRVEVTARELQALRHGLANEILELRVRASGPFSTQWTQKRLDMLVALEEKVRLLGEEFES